MNKLIISLLLVLVFCATSCSPTTNYFPEISVPITKKKNARAEFRQSKPQKTAYKIGSLSVTGTTSSSFDDVIQAAEKRARQEGGDFILLDTSGVNEKTFYEPGYIGCSSKTSKNTFSSRHPKKEQQVMLSFQPPRERTFRNPWGNFSVWVYAPCKLGLKLDTNAYIIGFDISSDGESQDVQIGDRLLGINGHDVEGPDTAMSLIDVCPGEKIQLILEREKAKITRTITALYN